MFAGVIWVYTRDISPLETANHALSFNRYSVIVHSLNTVYSEMLSLTQTKEYDAEDHTTTSLIILLNN